MSHTLTAAQKRYLKAEAHHLNPLIQVGQKGVTDNLIAETQNVLNHHELMKVKAKGYDKDDRVSIYTHLCEQTGAILVDTIGNIGILFLQRDKESAYRLPKK